jgi:ribosomal protein S18 acetylase RimI-like enzyme
MLVDVALHRGGFGSRLLAHSEQQLFARGNRTIRLETFENNHQAISFYLKNGWSVTKREADAEHGFIRVFFEKNA